MQQSRYAHAKQFKRARKCTRKLRTFLGRVMRDVERKAKAPGPELTQLLELGKRLYRQQRHDKNKLYSVHAPEVECISKGKAHKRLRVRQQGRRSGDQQGRLVTRGQGLSRQPV